MVGYFTFKENGDAIFEIEGQKFGGEDFNIQGREATLTYEMNTDITPIEIDFIVTDTKTGSEQRLLCIVEFSSEHVLKFASNFNGTRPKAFTEENSIGLAREH